MAGAGRWESKGGTAYRFDFGRRFWPPSVTDRAIEAWYRPSIAWAWPSTGGSHGKPHRTTKILSHARRCGSVAARCAHAASGDADELDFSTAGLLPRCRRGRWGYVTCGGIDADGPCPLEANRMVSGDRSLPKGGW